MAFQRVPQSAAVDILYLYGVKTIQNSPTFRYAPGGYTETNLTVLADLVDTWVHTSYKALFSNAVTYLRTEVRGLDQEFDFLKIDNTNTGIGSIPAQPLPLNATFCIKLPSQFTGRSARGRWFTVGNTDSQLNTGDKLTFNVTYRTAIITSLIALKAVAALQGWTWVIASRYHNGAKRVEAVTFDVQVPIYVNSDVDSQRGRLI